MTHNNLFFIRTKTPLHIGCDEVYEPVSFVVDEDKKFLISLDPLDFYSRLSAKDKQEFSGICREGTIQSLLKLNQFMRGKKAEGHSVAICSGFLEHYRDNLSMKTGDVKKIQNEINGFIIMRTAFLENTNEPYIPGSSIKGALRTACLNALAKTSGRVDYDPKDRKAAMQLEKGFLKFTDPETDPFRLIKVSDFLPVDYRTRIVYGVNEKKKSSKYAARGPYQILEVIESGALFAGTIQVEFPPPKNSGIQMPLTQDAVLKNATYFYSRERKREEDELLQAGLPVDKFQQSDRLVPLRIGRHSGAESVTIEGYRDIRIKGAGGRNTFSKTGAGTFWLASERKKDWDKNQLQPFGWVFLEKATEKTVAEMERLKAEFKEKRAFVAVDVAAKDEKGSSPAALQPDPPAPPVEEVWENAFVSFNSGGGGIVSAQSADKKKAEICGKEKARAATDAGMHKKLFDGKKTLPKARVTVRKVGNAWEIVKVEPAL